MARAIFFIQVNAIIIFNHCPFFPYLSASTKNTALVVSSDQVLFKSNQKSRTCIFVLGSMAEHPAHLGKSKWPFNTDFILLLLRVRMAGRSMHSQKKNVCSRMCFFLGAAEHCRSFLVSGCDFLLPFLPFDFSSCSSSERADHSCVSGAPSFPSFLANALCHSLPSLIDLQASLSGSLLAHGTPSSVPFISSAKS